MLKVPPLLALVHVALHPKLLLVLLFPRVKHSSAPVDFEGGISCQHWSRAVVVAHRAPEVSGGMMSFHYGSNE